MSDHQSSSGIDSDKSYKEKLRDKLARKLRQRKCLTKDFSESNTIASQNVNDYKENIGATMRDLMSNVGRVCFSITDILRDWNERANRTNDQDERIKTLAVRNFDAMGKINAMVVERRDEFGPIQPGTSSRNNDSVLNLSASENDSSGSSNSRSSRKASSTSGILFPKMDKYPGKCTDPEILLKYLCEQVTRVTSCVTYFLLQCKVEDKDILQNMEEKICYMLEDLSKLVGLANRKCV
ncbi:uncharacterized protein LOC116351952 isoform X1 [Contarinia nasturtii]|uniref:uncharacterized protein LOC116351952 isoform X1 n=1 Tax=Contarinia nasturtii TaxID=265458 RepID=UPI0012D38F9E|nr:uncharacterized protein LOC116351952 isoform X1 [Contarinia nasturtii]